MAEVPPVFYVNKKPENYSEKWCSLNDLKEGEMIFFSDNKFKNDDEVINNKKTYYINRLTVLNKEN